MGNNSTGNNSTHATSYVMPPSSGPYSVWPRPNYVKPQFPLDDRDTHLGDEVHIRHSDADEIEIYTDEYTHIYIRISDVLPNLVQWLAYLPVNATPAAELFAVAQEIESQAMHLEAAGDDALFARRAAVAVGEEAIKRETKHTHQWNPGDTALYGRTAVTIGPIYERQLGDGSQLTALCYWMEGSHRVEKVLEIKELKPCT